MVFRRPEPIETANEKVPIVVACRAVGIEVPDETVRRKLHCPFGGVYHSDGGLDPTFRVYEDSNSAYCFNCSSYFTPVSLAARAWGMTGRQAALRLLDLTGQRANLDYALIWNQREVEPELDSSMLAEALKTYCRRIDPLWSRRQFDAEIAARLTRCLMLLDLVADRDAAQLWLDTCKEAMRRELQAKTR